MEPLGQLPEHRVPRIGGHAFDEKLIPAHSQGQGVTPPQERSQPERHRLHGGGQEGMVRGIRGVLVKRNGELHQEYRQLTRENLSLFLVGR